MVGRRLIGAVCCVALGATAFAPGVSDAAVSVTRDVQYGNAEVRAPEPANPPLRMDVYRPATPSKRGRPVVVLIHGGGFARLTKSEPEIERIARGLAMRGIVVASIDYRLAGREPVPSRRVRALLDTIGAAPLSAAIVAAVDDTLTAIDYLRRHARRLGVDPDRLGLIGSSAGAITADHVAYVLDDHGIVGPQVRFVGSLWGGILVPPPGRTGLASVQLDRREAPLFAVHGDADPTIKVGFSDRLVARARAQGVPAEYHRIAGGLHGFHGARFFTDPVDGGATAYRRLLTFASARLR